MMAKLQIKNLLELQSLHISGWWSHFTWRFSTLAVPKTLNNVVSFTLTQWWWRAPTYPSGTIRGSVCCSRTLWHRHVGSEDRTDDTLVTETYCHVNKKRPNIWSLATKLTEPTYSGMERRCWTGWITQLQEKKKKKITPLCSTPSVFTLCCCKIQQYHKILSSLVCAWKCCSLSVSPCLCLGADEKVRWRNWTLQCDRAQTMGI